MKETYDAIVIGSGIGGLAVAAILSKIGHKRVLVLERHFKAGGFTHSFTRPGGWEWDVGLHYVGGMAPGSTARTLFDFVTDGRTKWNPMPDDYDHFHYAGFRFNAPKGEEQFKAALIAQFPREASPIGKYFRDLKSASRWVVRQFMANSMPAPLASVVRTVNRVTSGLALMTTGEYLDRHFADPQLRALLASQWGDYGLPPARSAFAIHALIATHYFGGAWYPEGGAGTIADGAMSAIREAGGDVRINHEVRGILIEDGKACGVEARRNVGKGGEVVRLYAPVIVSDVGAANTFNKLVPEEVPFRKELDALTKNFTSTATLYIGFKSDPCELGFRGENHWIFDSLDHDKMLAESDELLAGKAQFCYLSFPSLKDPLATRHTAEIIAPVSYEAFAKFKGEPWRRRGVEYDAMKATIARALLGLVEKHYPGFSELVEFQEVSTPLSVEYFTAHPGGGIYGIPATPDRFRQAWLAPKTHIQGLYLTGTDAGTLGIHGAMMGGVATASQLLGSMGFLRTMIAANREARRTVAPMASPVTNRA